MNTIYLDAKDVPAYLRGNYTGKRFSVNISTQGIVPTDSYDTYKIVELATGRSVLIGDPSTAWERGKQSFAMQPGFLVIQHSRFGLIFTVHPDDATKFLPRAETLTPFEYIVLNATVRYKSSCNGRDRYEMAKTSYSNTPYPTRAEWECAKQSLIARKLLNRAGAVTTNGRNPLSQR
jgi:hypothetical protein